MIERTRGDIAEDLVMIWYRWTLAHRPHLGHSNACATFRDAPSTESREDADADERDARIARQQAESVDACIDALTWQMRVSVDLHCANRHSGNAVFRHARLSSEELHALYQSAKAILMQAFIRRGLMV